MAAKAKQAAKSLMPYAAAVLLPALLFSTVLASVRISGSSMLPGLHDGDLILCVRHSAPERGDVVVLDAGGKTLVKRVVAMAGDTVSLGADGLLVNGEPVQEPYVMPGEHGAEFGETAVPDGCVFVLGDNRAASKDSRDGSIGFVAMADIIGRMVWKAGT